MCGRAGPRRIDDHGVCILMDPKQKAKQEKFKTITLSLKRHSEEFVQYRVIVVASELLSKVSRGCFTNFGFYLIDSLEVHCSLFLFDGIYKFTIRVARLE